MAGQCDEPKLVMDMLAALIGCETVTACAHTYLRYVEPVEASIDPDTLDQLARALRIRVDALAPPV